MSNIGKIDFESNVITVFRELDDNEVQFEESFEVTDSMRIHSNSNSAEIWVSESLIGSGNKTMIRVLPTKLPIGYKFRLIPTERLVRGSVYLITDQLIYKYNLTINEKR